MSEFTLVSQGTHVQQLGRDCRIQDKVPVEQSANVFSITPRSGRAKYVLHFLDGFIPTRDTLRYATIANIGLMSVFVLEIARNVVDSRCVRSLPPQQGYVPVVGVGIRVITKVIPMAIRRQRSRAGGDGQLVLLVWRAVFPRWRSQRVQWGTIRVNWQVLC
jgi:hypothetical protein